MNPLVKITSLLAVFVSCAAIGFAQEKAETKSLTSTASAVASGADTRIPRNSKVFIAPMEGFENYLAAALRKKDVPLIVVADREAADFEIVGTSETKRAGAMKILLTGNTHSDEMASIQVINLRTKVVAFADSSNRRSALRGKRSTSEKLAKKLGEKMKEDEKKAP